ncbi:MAG: hypothetical protein GC145_12640 [Caulobacter sp.]|nr:hypothetical protein [Caulobacter sp.]
MFVAIYRMKIRPGHEEQYARDWAAATQVAIDDFGSGGSSLFRDQNGDFVAIARWRSREDRQAFFDRPQTDLAAFERRKAAVLESLPTIELDSVEDLWTAFPLNPA